MFAETGFTPLFLDLERMTWKSKAGGGNKSHVAWKVETAMHYFVHADKNTKDYSTD